MTRGLVFVIFSARHFFRGKGNGLFRRKSQLLNLGGQGIKLRILVN
jgi:hypothetical protein